MGEPKLRFKADDGSDFPDWEEMTLGDVGSVAMCKRVFKEQTCEVGDMPFFKIGTFGGAPDAYISQSLFDELKSKYAYPKVGTILLSASGTIGRQVEYKGEDAYYQDSNIVWLEHDDTVLDSYLKQFYSVVKWQGLEGSTIKRLYNKTILDTPFYRPSLHEQRKIADFLSAVDAVIAAQQAEVDAWEQRKKGVMQKLFSQEVRFKADDGSDFPDWEEQKIEDVCVLNPRTEQLDDEFYYMDLGSIDHGRWEAPEIVNKVDAPSRAQRVAAIDDVFFQSVRPYNMGHYHYVAAKDKQVVASTGYIQARMRNGSNAFLYQLFYEERFNAEVNARCTGSNYPAINSRKFGEITVALPSLPEQRKIADCLSALDDVIIKAKNELAKWQELKKGLLQQMFV